MNEPVWSFSQQDVRKLLGAANGDAALLYLYLHTGQGMEHAGQQLRMSEARLSCALAALQQLGLVDAAPRRMQLAPEKPVYTEADVLQRMNRGTEFAMLVQEAQRQLGRVLSTEELKILLSLMDYLGLPSEVISLLITYCLQKNRVRGVQRAPSIRMIEREAYHWADNGIDTLEAAAAYTQNQLQLHSRIGEIRNTLQLEGRRLTMAEEKYVVSWLEMGFGKTEIHMAYEKTCLNKGALVWPYMNRILLSWHEQGLHTAAQINARDAGASPRKKQQSDSQPAVSPMGKAAIARLLAEEEG